MRAERADRLELDVATVDLDPVLILQRGGHVRVRDRAEEAALLADAGGDADLDRAQALGELLRLSQALCVLFRAAVLEDLNLLEGALGGFGGEAAAQQKVAGVTGRDVFDVAGASQIRDVVQ